MEPLWQSTAEGTHITCKVNGEEMRLPDWKAAFTQCGEVYPNGQQVPTGIDHLSVVVDFGDAVNQPFQSVPFDGRIPVGTVLQDVRFYAQDSEVKPPGHCGQLTVRTSEQSGDGQFNRIAFL
jgi:hypothetical protein